MYWKTCADPIVVPELGFELMFQYILVDSQAANILVDAVIANHLLRDVLGSKLRGLPPNK